MTVDPIRDLALHPFEGRGDICDLCGEDKTWHPTIPKRRAAELAGRGEERDV